MRWAKCRLIGSWAGGIEIDPWVWQEGSVEDAIADRGLVADLHWLPEVLENLNQLAGAALNTSLQHDCPLLIQNANR